jgi:hypothetical protein
MVRDMAVSVVGMMRDLEPRRGSFGCLAIDVIHLRDGRLGVDRHGRLLGSCIGNFHELLSDAML